MNALLRAAASPVRRAPWLVVATIVVLTAILAAIASTAGEPTSDFEDFATDSPAAVASDEISQRFGGERGRMAQLAVVDRGGDVLSPEVVAEVAGIVERLSTDPAVQEAAVPQGPEGQAGPLVATYAAPVLQVAQVQGLDVTALDDEALDQLYATATAEVPEGQAAQLSLLLSGDAAGGDATAGMLVVSLDPTVDDEAVDAARNAINAEAGTLDSGAEVYTLDFQELSEQANDELAAQLGTLLGVTFLLIVLILAAVYRSVTDVLASLVGLVFTIMWMQGLGTLFGPDWLGLTGGMSQMTMAVPILLVGLGVDYGIHLTMRAREEKAAGQPPAEAAHGAITAVGAALALATITTMVGFLTNLANPLPPLQDFGVVAAAGVLSAFVVMTLFVPSVRLLVDRRRVARGKAIVRVADGESEVGVLGRVSSALAPTAVRRPALVLSLAGLLTVAAGVGASQLSTEFSQTDFFPEDSRALETIEVVDEQFGGGVDEATSVLVEGDVVSARGLQALAAFQEGLAELPDVRTFDGTARADGLIARLGRAGLLPEALASDQAAAAAVAQLHEVDPAAPTVVTEAGDATVLRVSTTAGEDADVLARDIDALAQQTLQPAGLRQQATSEQLVIGEVLAELQNSQMTGLLITLLASMAILALAFWARDRAPMLGVLAILSVGFTAVWVLGLMSLLGIPFNVMTAMVSSLAIGIGVPFGIHVVNRFLEDRRTRSGVEDAMRHTLRHTGGALVGSAVTTVAGFGVLAFSTIPPMQQFGIVTAVTIALALVVSLTVLPSMLALWARAADRRGGRPADVDPVDRGTRPHVTT